MTTTVLIVEHLIAGIQVLCWGFLLVLARFGTEWINIELVSSSASAIALFLLALVYPLGVVCDTVADSIGKRWVGRINRSIYKEASVPEDTTAFEVISKAKNDFVTSYFNYLRSRIRAARCLSFNLACTVVVLTTLWLCGSNVLGVNVPTFWGVILAMVILIVVTVFAWRGMCIQAAKRVAFTYGLHLADSERKI